MPLDKSKDTYLGYREAARAMYTHEDLISVPEHATVQIVERGAFVEAHVFVPRDHLEAFLKRQKEKA